MANTPSTEEPLLLELRGLIEQARQQVAQVANSTLTLLYWRVGHRINCEILQGQRAGYGEQIVSRLSTQLVSDYGKGFGLRSLQRMVQFAEAFPDEQQVVALAGVLSWSHFVEILPLKKPLEREYYAQMCSIERWSVFTLRERISSQLYLRTALSKKPEPLVDTELKNLRARGQITPDLVFRDPYMLDFLGLPDGYSDSEQVELLDLSSANIRVAEYLDKIPDITLLRAQLQRSVQRARERAATGALPHEHDSAGDHS